MPGKRRGVGGTPSATRGLLVWIPGEGMLVRCRILWVVTRIEGCTLTFRELLLTLMLGLWSIGQVAGATESKVAPGSFEAGLEIYDAANAAGDPFHEGYKQALAIWEPLASAGHPGALYHVGLLYYLGPGRITVNQAKGHALIRKAANGGYGTAQGLLGFMSEKGDGLIQNRGPDIALRWYMLGAHHRHCASLRRIIKAYEIGDLGLKIDSVAAERWSQRLEGCTKR